MTTSAPSRSNLATLDARITQALMTLRLVRGDGPRVESRESIEAEQRAEANLNALLDFRFFAQRR